MAALATRADASVFQALRKTGALLRRMQLMDAQECEIARMCARSYYHTAAAAAAAARASSAACSISKFEVLITAVDAAATRALAIDGKLGEVSAPLVVIIAGVPRELTWGGARPDPGRVPGPHHVFAHDGPRDAPDVPRQAHGPHLTNAVPAAEPP